MIKSNDSEMSYDMLGVPRPSNSDLEKKAWLSAHAISVDLKVIIKIDLELSKTAIGQ